MSDRLAVMNDGRFEQIGPPEEVYDDPESRFVADFLGTANIFDGTVTAVDGGVATVDAGDVTLSTRAESWATPNASVSVVVRPERLRFAADGDAAADGGAANVIEGTVSFKRHLGSSVEFRIETDDGRELVVVRRSGSDDREAGDRVAVSITPEDCRLVEE